MMVDIVTYLCMRAEAELDSLLQTGFRQAADTLHSLYRIAQRLEELGFEALGATLRNIGTSTTTGMEFIGQVVAARRAIAYVRMRLYPYQSAVQQYSPHPKQSQFPSCVEVLLLAPLRGLHKGTPDWISLVRGLWLQQDGYSYTIGAWMPVGYVWSKDMPDNLHHWTTVLPHPLLATLPVRTALAEGCAYRLPNAFFVGAVDIGTTASPANSSDRYSLILPVMTTLDPEQSLDVPVQHECGITEDAVLTPAIAWTLEQEWGSHGYFRLPDLPLVLHDSRYLRATAAPFTATPLNETVEANLQRLRASEGMHLLLSLTRQGRGRDELLPIALLTHTARRITQKSGIERIKVAAEMYRNGTARFRALTDLLLSDAELQSARIG